MPLKNKMKMKCVKLSKVCEFVLLVSAEVVDFDLEAFRLVFTVRLKDGNVSGKQKYRYVVSTIIRNREKPAAVAKGFATTVSTLARAAPSAGPKVKAMEKHAPTNAIVAPRCFSSLISAAIAVAICTFPSLSPPTTLLARKVRKSMAATHNATETMLPVIDHSKAVRRPYLSESVPIIGEAMACRKENREPRAPPSKTIS